MCDFTAVNALLGGAAAAVVIAAALVTTAAILNAGFFTAPGSPGFMIGAGASTVVAVGLLIAAHTLVQDGFACAGSPGACEGDLSNTLNALDGLMTVLGIQAAACFAAAAVAWAPGIAQPAMWAIFATFLLQGPLIVTAGVFYSNLRNCLRAEETRRTALPLVERPDLVVTAIESVGPPDVDADGSVRVPLRVTIANRGASGANEFKMATEYTAAGAARATAPFSVAGQSDTWYPRSNGVLTPGAEVTIAGTVTLPSSLRGRAVSLTAWADSCAGDEFMPDFCRVDERSELNNQSLAVRLSLP
jgi:hypothetical protein